MIVNEFLLKVFVIASEFLLEIIVVDHGGIAGIGGRANNFARAAHRRRFAFRSLVAVVAGHNIFIQRHVGRFAGRVCEIVCVTIEAFRFEFFIFARECFLASIYGRNALGCR